MIRVLQFIAISAACMGLISCQSAPQSQEQVVVSGDVDQSRSRIVPGPDVWETPLHWQVADSFTNENGNVQAVHGHKTKRVIVPVTLTNSDGSTAHLNFLVDTGADNTVVNTRRVKANLTNAKIEDAAGIGGVQKISIVNVPRLAVGAMVQENSPVAFTEMPVEQDGLLGQAFLRHFIVTIDYQRGIFRLERVDHDKHHSKTGE